MLIPNIQTATPATITAGRPDTTVMIIGSGFASAVVEANGKPLATIPVSATQLNAVIPASMTATAGTTITIVVMNLLPSGNITSNPFTITVTAGAGQAPAPDLSVAITNVGTFTAGTKGVLTITVANGGNGPTTGNITVTDNLPNALTFASGSGAGWNCGAVSQMVTCNNAGPIAPNGVSTITLTVAVGAAAVPSVTDSANVSTPGDRNTGTKSASVTVTVNPAALPPAPDLSIAIMNMGSFTAGTNGVFTITVTNVGNGPTTGNVAVTDTLPNGLTFVSEAGAGWNCAAVGQMVTCNNAGPIAPNGVSTFMLTVAVGAAAVPSVTDSASVSTPGDRNTGTKSASVTVTVNAMGPPPAGDIGIILDMNASGMPGNAEALTLSITMGDPFVSFSSLATNLVPNDTNGQPDVFVACVALLGEPSCPTPIARVSLTSSGGQIPAGATGPPGPFPTPTPITADGRFVAFASSDPNVVTPATTGTQIYVRDTCVGAPAGCMPTTFLASAKTTGGIGSTGTDSPSISANGRVVAFFAGSFFLPPAVGGFQIIARDTCFGAPMTCTPSALLVSADNSGTPGNVFSNHPSVSGDGRFVAFESSSGNLVVPPAAGITTQIFERDTCIGAPAGCTPSTVLISGNTTGAPSNKVSQNPSVNGDGRFVVFFSQSTDIVPGTTQSINVFLRDTCGGSNGPVAGCAPSTTLVSAPLSGGQPNALSIAGPPGSSISATGRFIAFASGATNLLPTASTPGQIYVLDTCFGAPAGCTRALHKVTVDSTGAEVGSSGPFALSGDGRFLAFTNLVGTPPNQIQHVFLAFTGF